MVSRAFAGYSSALVVGLAATCLTAAPASATPPVQWFGPAHRVAAVEDHAAHFRRSMGLSSAGAARGRAGASPFGVRLSRAQNSELLRRQQVIADDAPRVRRVVRRLGGEHALGGLWMDNRGGGKLTVALTSSTPRLRRAVAGAVRHRDRLRIVSATHSRLKLARIAEQLIVSRDSVPAGVEIAATSVDERRNVVRVEVNGNQARAERWLKRRYAGAARAAAATVTASAERGIDSPPFRGGQSIIGDETTVCTSAFVAHDVDRFYLLTAGHCGGVGSRWTQEGIHLGIAERRTGDGADALAIRMNRTHRTNTVTAVYRDPDGPDPAVRQTITSMQSVYSDAVGQITCVTGRNTWLMRCGEVLSLTYFSPPQPDSEDPVRYTNGRELDVTCSPGDSGGAAFYRTQARGLISAAVDRDGARDTCVYTHISPALSRLGLRLFTGD